MRSASPARSRSRSGCCRVGGGKSLGDSLTQLPNHLDEVAKKPILGSVKSGSGFDLQQLRWQLRAAPGALVGPPLLDAPPALRPAASELQRPRSDVARLPRWSLHVMSNECAMRVMLHHRQQFRQTGARGPQGPSEVYEGVVEQVRLIETLSLIRDERRRVEVEGQSRTVARNILQQPVKPVRIELVARDQEVQPRQAHSPDVVAEVDQVALLLVLRLTQPTGQSIWQPQRANRCDDVVRPARHLEEVVVAGLDRPTVDCGDRHARRRIVTRHS